MTAAQAAAGSDSDAPGRVGRRVVPVVRTGLVLGLGVWAASLVELPLLGVAPPVWCQKPGQIATDVGFHLVYGFAAAAALAVLRRTPD